MTTFYNEYCLLFQCFYLTTSRPPNSPASNSPKWPLSMRRGPRETTDYAALNPPQWLMTSTIRRCARFVGPSDDKVPRGLRRRVCVRSQWLVVVACGVAVRGRFRGHPLAASCRAPGCALGFRGGGVLCGRRPGLFASCTRPRFDQISVRVGNSPGRRHCSLRFDQMGVLLH